jgi:hypothetical protein
MPTPARTFRDEIRGELLQTIEAHRALVREAIDKLRAAEPYAKLLIAMYGTSEYFSVLQFIDELEKAVAEDKTAAANLLARFTDETP